MVALVEIMLQAFERCYVLFAKVVVASTEIVDLLL